MTIKSQQFKTCTQFTLPTRWNCWVSWRWRRQCEWSIRQQVVRYNVICTTGTWRWETARYVVSMPVKTVWLSTTAMNAVLAFHTPHTAPSSAAMVTIQFNELMLRSSGADPRFLVRTVTLVWYYQPRGFIFVLAMTWHWPGWHTVLWRNKNNIK